MKRAFLIAIVFAGAYSAAQDRTITVREIDVQPLKGELNVTADGGCTFTAYVKVTSPSVEPNVSHSAYDVSDTPFCVTGKAKIVLAGKKDLQVGTGAPP